MLPEQQPAQLPGPHSGAAWQVRSFGSPWATHCRPVAVQFVHACPCLPQAIESLPATQTLPLQQPPQFAGLQVGVPWHWPPAPLGEGPQV